MAFENLMAISTGENGKEISNHQADDEMRTATIKSKTTSNLRDLKEQDTKTIKYFHLLTQNQATNNFEKYSSKKNLDEAKLTNETILPRIVSRSNCLQQRNRHDVLKQDIASHLAEWHPCHLSSTYEDFCCHIVGNCKNEFDLCNRKDLAPKIISLSLPEISKFQKTQKRSCNFTKMFKKYFSSDLEGNRSLSFLCNNPSWEDIRGCNSCILPVSFSYPQSTGNHKKTSSLYIVKILLTDEIAGYLLGVGGRGLEVFHQKHGPGVHVSVSRRYSIFPCLGDRISTVVGVPSNLLQCLKDIVHTATLRMTYRQEAVRIDNGNAVPKPKICFKLVIPESSISVFSASTYEMFTISKKNRTEIIVSEPGDWLHNQLGSFSIKERVVQVIGLPESVVAAILEIVPLYQHDPSLSSFLHLSYAPITPGTNFRPPPPSFDADAVTKIHMNRTSNFYATSSKIISNDNDRNSTDVESTYTNNKFIHDGCSSDLKFSDLKKHTDLLRANNFKVASIDILHRNIEKNGTDRQNFEKFKMSESENSSLSDDNIHSFKGETLFHPSNITSCSCGIMKKLSSVQNSHSEIVNINNTKKSKPQSVVCLRTPSQKKYHFEATDSEVCNQDKSRAENTHLQFLEQIEAAAYCCEVPAKKNNILSSSQRISCKEEHSCFRDPSTFEEFDVLKRLDFRDSLHEEPYIRISNERSDERETITKDTELETDDHPLDRSSVCDSLYNSDPFGEAFNQSTKILGNLSPSPATPFTHRKNILNNSLACREEMIFNESVSSATKKARAEYLVSKETCSTTDSDGLEERFKGALSPSFQQPSQRRDQEVTSVILKIPSEAIGIKENISLVTVLLQRASNASITPCVQSEKPQNECSYEVFGTIEEVATAILLWQALVNSDTAK